MGLKAAANPGNLAPRGSYMTKTSKIMLSFALLLILSVSLSLSAKALDDNLELSIGFAFDRLGDFDGSSYTGVGFDIAGSYQLESPDLFIFVDLLFFFPSSFKVTSDYGTLKGDIDSCWGYDLLAGVGYTFSFLDDQLTLKLGGGFDTALAKVTQEGSLVDVSVKDVTFGFGVIADLKYYFYNNFFAELGVRGVVNVYGGRTTKTTSSKIKDDDNHPGYSLSAKLGIGMSI